jgi:hypothetical protein
MKELTVKSRLAEVFFEYLKYQLDGLNRE